MIGISITPEDVEKTRGLSGKLDDLTLEVSPYGGHLVAVAQFEGCNVCWACCEPFAPEGPERMIEVVLQAAVPTRLRWGCTRSAATRRRASPSRT